MEYLESSKVQVAHLHHRPVGYRPHPGSSFASIAQYAIAKRTGERETESIYAVRIATYSNFNSSMDIEAQSQTPRYLTGFPSLAAFIASDRDHTSAIFKRFNRLGARNLLHLQSELSELQVQQDALDEAARSGPPSEKQYSRNWADFCRAALSDDRQKERMALAEKISATLHEYRMWPRKRPARGNFLTSIGEALYFESHLATLAHPPQSTLRAFRSNFFNGDPRTGFPTLGGQSATLFNDPDDLVVLGVQADRDRLTAFVQDRLAWMFQSRARDGNIAYASDHRITSFVAFVSTANAAALLIGAIVSLYSVSSSKKKLGIIAVFTTLFAINVGVLTNARRAELFAATAGYAAVLVVFVSGNLSVPSSNNV